MTGARSIVASDNASVVFTPRSMPTSQHLLLAAAHDRRPQHRGVRQRQRCLHAPVDADQAFLTPRRARHLWLSSREADMPAARLISDAGHAELAIRHRAAEPELHQPQFRDKHLRPFTIHRLHTAVANAESLVEMFTAPCRPIVGVIEKRRRRAVEIPQSLLLHRRGSRRQPPELLPGFSKLFLPGRRTRPAPPPPTAIELLDRQIPHKTGIGAMPLQHEHRLPGSRIHAVAVRHRYAAVGFRAPASFWFST
nr:hypothetical protein [Mycobacterium branderi]